MPLSDHSETLARILALAVKELFPAATPIRGGKNSLGFYYQFLLEQPLDRNALILVEERMRQLIKRKLPIYKMEMMHQLAINFLQAKGNSMAALWLKRRVGNVVDLIQIGEWADWCEGEPSEEIDGFTALKLLQEARLSIRLPAGEKVEAVQIAGVAFCDKMALKQFNKRYDLAKKWNHVKLGEELNLFSFGKQGECRWHPKGVELKKLILNQDPFSACRLETGEIQLEKLAAVHTEIFCRRKHRMDELPLITAEKIGFYREEKGEQGLFDLQHPTIEITHQFCPISKLQNLMISNLQFIHKIGKMYCVEQNWRFIRAKRTDKSINELLVEALKCLGVDYCEERSVTAAGSRIEVLHKDLLGQEWSGPFLQLMPFQQIFCSDERGREEALAVVQCSMFGPVERWIALIVELSKGELPLSVVPEQVRLEPVELEHIPYARKVCAYLVDGQVRAKVDETDRTLGERVWSARQERVPCIVILGDHEQKIGKVTVARDVHEKAKRVTIEQLIEQFKVQSPFDSKIGLREGKLF